MHTHVTSTGADTPVPRAGMLATVRNRRGVVAAVEPSDGETRRLHLVHLEYADNHTPTEERLLWELSRNATCWSRMRCRTRRTPAARCPADDFDALLRAARWTALSPYLDPAGGDGRAPHQPVASPFHGGGRIENYQLMPLLKTLRMPRVSLLIAEDVGLGQLSEPSGRTPPGAGGPVVVSPGGDRRRGGTAPPPATHQFNHRQARRRVCSARAVGQPTTRFTWPSPRSRASNTC